MQFDPLDAYAFVTVSHSFDIIYVAARNGFLVFLDVLHTYIIIILSSVYGYLISLCQLFGEAEQCPKLQEAVWPPVGTNMVVSSLLF